jgi:hypothetical protein
MQIVSTRMPHALPAFVTAMDRVADAPTQTLAERAALLAAVRWVNPDGELWPSLGNWARMASLSVRALRRVLRDLTRRGLIVPVVVSRGGAGRTSRYRIPILANPDTRSGMGEVTTRTHGPGNPDKSDQKPGHTVRPSISINQGTSIGGTFVPRNPTDDDLRAVYGRAPR